MLLELRDRDVLSSHSKSKRWGGREGVVGRTALLDTSDGFRERTALKMDKMIPLPSVLQPAARSQAAIKSTQTKLKDNQKRKRILVVCLITVPAPNKF